LQIGIGEIDRLGASAGQAEQKRDGKEWKGKTETWPEAGGFKVHAGF
jgi:hypothetical protein